MAPAAVLTSMAVRRERPWAFPGVSAACGARRVGISPGTEWRSAWRLTYPSEKYEFVSWDDYPQDMEK